MVEPADCTLALLRNSSVNTNGDVYLVHVRHVVAHLRVGVSFAQSAEEWAVFGDVADTSAAGALFYLVFISFVGGARIDASSA